MSKERLHDKESVRTKEQMLRSLPSISSSDKLAYRIVRLIEKQKKLAFVLGSGLTVPSDSHRGVLSTSAIVDLIETRFADAEGQRLWSDALGQATGAKAYQSAMQLLVECEGQGGLNEVISQAVLDAYTGPAPSEGLDGLEICENDLENWDLNQGVVALAEIYNAYPELIGPLLTSNFDPLIGIAVKKLGGSIEVFPISEDGSITRFQTTASHRRIIHFHGYWRGIDTLHTPDQITRPRPKLAGELRRLLRDTSLVVLGYGGWNDVFTETLSTIIAEGSVTGDVLWAFREVGAIPDKYADLLDRLEPQIGSRVILYGGVDSNWLLPEIHDRLHLKTAPLVGTSPSESSFVATLLGRTAEKLRDSYKDPGCDPPPTALHWTGRAREMNALHASNYRVSFITGIGGQGKSCLASAFLDSVVSAGDLSFWDWRDCREERNHMRTNLMNICNRLSRGRVLPEDLKDVTDDSLVESVFNLLESHRAVFVFDNVDEYIDLVDLVPTGLVKLVIDEALKRSDRTRLIFTCRPNISLVAENLLQLNVLGFTEPEGVELFSKYKIALEQDELAAIAKRATILTNGHPFWLNIIAAQAVIGGSTAQAFMDDLEYGDVASSATESDVLARQMLSAVWQRLNEKQKVLLRGMAEAVCEETKDQLAKVLKTDLSYNAVGKALKRLRQLNLIVIKPTHSGVEYFDLHPLVRRFVRTKGSREQRNKYIAMFVVYFDNMIRSLTPDLGSRASFSNLRNWSYKIELEMNRGSFSSAIATLHDASDKMERAGYLEEYIRLAELIFGKIDWDQAVATKLRYFDVEVCWMIQVLSQLGRYVDADSYVQRLSERVDHSSLAYLRLCEAAAMRYWLAEEYSEAIRYGRIGANLKRRSGADVHVDVEHAMALALRDTKQSDNLQEALSIFLGGNSMETLLLTEDTETHSMAFYGNIGRCLQFMDRLDDAMHFYRMSLESGAPDDDDATSYNKAYAFWWIGEVFDARDESFTAAHFFRYAQTIWLRNSPPLARKMAALIEGLIQKLPEVAAISAKGEIELRSFCESRLIEATRSTTRRQ